MQDYVLHDLEAWLKDPARRVSAQESDLHAVQMKVEGLSAEDDSLISESASQADVITGLRSRVSDLEGWLASSQSVAYFAAIIGVLAMSLALLFGKK